MSVACLRRKDLCASRIGRDFDREIATLSQHFNLESPSVFGIRTFIYDRSPYGTCHDEGRDHWTD